MVNSLGLDMHGTSVDQDQGRPDSDIIRSTSSPHIQPQEDSQFSWGILASTQQDTEASRGKLANTTQGDTVESWGAVEEPQNDKIETWGTVEEPQSWGTVDKLQSWDTVDKPQKVGKAKGTVDKPRKVGKVKGTVDSTTEGPQKDDDRSKDREDSWGTPDEPSTSHKDDKSKKDKGIPYVPAAPPARVRTSPAAWLLTY
jgi:hypothetical protein